ncbi:MAG: hypothetical protein AAAFM81_10655 [Pseudomonadota bacterium]
MAKIRHLAKVAMNGFTDMAPALRRAFNDSPDDDQLSQVFGQKPRTAILLISAACIAGGYLFVNVTPEFGIKDLINWPAAFTGVVFAILFRRYLFHSGTATTKDFDWLAASIIPATIALVLLGIITNIINGVVEPVEDGPFYTIIGYPAELLARSCSVAAAITIAVAALTYSRNWVAAAIELGVNMIVFVAVLWFMAFMMFEVEIMDRILSALFESILGITFPSWLGDFADQITYAALLLAFYFSVIGATWMVCRQEFATLLETGEVEIIKAVKKLMDPPTEKQLQKQADKEAKKAAKAEAKAAKKAEKEKTGTTTD